MTPEEMQRRIREAVDALDAMSDETIELGINAGLLDRRHPRWVAIQQNRCAEGQHDFHPNWHRGLCRCSCGAAHPDDLAAALAPEDR